MTIRSIASIVMGTIRSVSMSFTQPLSRHTPRLAGILVGLLMGLYSTSAVAQPAQTQPAPQAQTEQPAQKSKTLKVATKPFKPFVYQQNGEWVGFSIDLWRELARVLGVQYEIVGTETVAELLNTLRHKEADLAVAGLTITSEREQAIDFSFPFYQSGLQIMVSSHHNDASSDLLQTVFSVALLKLLAGLLATLLFAAHLLWVFERKRNPNMFPEGYLSGVGSAFWWAAATLTTVGYGDKVPQSTLGRTVGFVWMFAGILLISYFTASVTTVLTVNRLEGNIRGPKDLPGKLVGSTRGSTATKWLYANSMAPTEFDTIEEGYKAVEDGKIDALVYDSPVLLYHAAHEGKGRLRVVGSVFEKQGYGIALQEHSPLREQVNRALLTLQEDGTYGELYRKWFGD
jgi:polar amino acid transport system substrate-binding protein